MLPLILQRLPYLTSETSVIAYPTMPKKFMGFGFVLYDARFFQAQYGNKLVDSEPIILSTI